jgi:hypothetical protein
MPIIQKAVNKPSKSWYQDISSQVAGNQYIINRYFDPEFVDQINRHVMVYLNEIYFRPRFIGFDDFPERNNPGVPLIFASNHSGMAFPWDAIVLASNTFKLFKFDSRCFRPLSSPMLSESALMNPFLCDNLWYKSGAIDATFLNFETMMNQSSHNLLIYPEGVPGIGKGFNKRYQLQRFSSSFITMSLKYKTDIVPIHTVNGEFINPLAYNIPWLNRLVNKVGIPYLPLGLVTPLLIVAPWFFYAAFPARLTYVVGERIKPYTWINKPVEELTWDELVEIKERVHNLMQDELLRAVENYGKRPYEIGGLLKKVFSNLKHFPYPYPFGWPLLFSEFHSRFKKRKGGEVDMKLGFLSSIRILFSRWKHLYLYLPVLGWLPLLNTAYRDFRKRHRQRIENLKR